MTPEQKEWLKTYGFSKEGKYYRKTYNYFYCDFCDCDMVKYRTTFNERCFFYCDISSVANEAIEIERLIDEWVRLCERRELDKLCYKSKKNG